MRLIILAALVSLSGCATMFDYCDLNLAKRCDLEGQMNSRLDAIGSQAQIALQCPGEDLCIQPTTGTESGDRQLIVVKPRQQ